MLTARKRQPKRDGTKSSASSLPPPQPATSKDYGYDCSGGTSVDWGDVGVDSLQ